MSIITPRRRPMAPEVRRQAQTARTRRPALPAARVHEPTGRLEAHPWARTPEGRQR